MNVITTVVFATALLTVSDVTCAAQPAVVKSIQATSVSTQVVAGKANIVAAGAVAVREAGQRAQKQIVRESLQQNWRQLAAESMPLPDVPENLTEDESRHMALKD